MIRLVRLMRLGLELAGRRVWRTLVMVVLVVLGFSVFLVVTAIAASSQEELATEIDRVNGPQDVFVVRATGAAGQTPTEQVTAGLAQITADLPQVTTVVYESHSSLHVGCTTDKDLPGLPVMVVKHADGRAAHDLPWASALTGEELCLDGTPLPDGSVSRVAKAYDGQLTDAVIVDTQAHSLVDAMVSSGRSTVAVVRHGGAAAQVGSQLRHMCDELNASDTTNGRDPAVTCDVLAAEKDSGLSQAGNNVKLTFSVLGWAVLALAGLGIGTVQMMVVKDRQWLYGLAQAAGAVRREIAGLIVWDVAIVLGCGLAITFGALTALQPTITQFSQNTFGTSAHLIHSGNTTQVFVAAVLILGLGSCLPVIHAWRMDPIDILEA